MNISKPSTAPIQFSLGEAANQRPPIKALKMLDNGSQFSKECGPDLSHISSLWNLLLQYTDKVRLESE
jgi:hypothetical protein